MLGYSLGWLIHHPNDWKNVAIMAPLAALLTLATYGWGIRKTSRLEAESRLVFKSGMIAAALLGVLLFGMLALKVIS